MLRMRSAGFTLIEVMVALVIVSLGMMAVNTQLNRYTVAATYVEQKTLASWIATNKLTELSIAPTWPSVGDYEEDVEFAGQQWRCTSKSQKRPSPICIASMFRSLSAAIPSASCTKSRH